MSVYIVHRTNTLIVAGAILAVSGPASAAHYSEWGLAVPVVEVNSPAGDGCPIESPDGLSLYLASNRTGTLGGNDIWVAERPSKDAAWGEPQNLGVPVNSAASDYCPTPLHGNWLLFVSERPGPDTCNAGPGSGDIYLIRRSPAHGWGEPRHLGCVATGTGPNTAGAEFSPSLVETDAGTFLFFSSNGGGNMDIYVSRLGADGRFEAPEVVSELSTEYDDRMPNVSKDGLEVVFSSTRPVDADGQPSFGGQDVYRSTRASVLDPWSPPVNVGPNVNTGGSETRASMSWDRTRMLFGRDGEIYVSRRSKVRGH